MFMCINNDPKSDESRVLRLQLAAPSHWSALLAVGLTCSISNPESVDSNIQPH